MKEPKNIKYKITDLKTDIAQNDDIVKINQIIANLEDINEQDESSYTALIWAVYRNNLAIVKALLTHPNIDVNKDELYPFFINEAAYYEKGFGFAVGKKCIVEF